MSAEKKYNADQVKKMLGDSMQKFRASMIGLIRECAVHPLYMDLPAREALTKVADKLSELQDKEG